MSLLEEIDKLREEAARLAALKNTYFHSPLTALIEEWNVRCTLEGVEEKINALLQQYIALPPCPYPPCTGRMETTPTRHTMICTKCAAVVIPGRMDVVMHVYGVASATNTLEVHGAKPSTIKEK